MSNFSEAFPHRLLEDVYELDRVASWICDSDLKNVALQFPSELLSDACVVTKILGKKCNVDIIIMGENNFGSTCCVDEHAASTVSADGIVHFGHSCLSPHSILKVMYVFGNQEISEEKFLYTVENILTDTKAIVITCDVIFYKCLETICHEKMKRRNFFLVNNGAISQLMDCTNFGSWEDCKTYIKGEFTLLHVGTDIEHATSLMLKHPASRYYFFSPFDSEIKEISTVKNILARKRYYLVEKIKESSLIGILVGTLEVGNSVKILSKLKKMIVAAGKRSCLIIIGKVTPAKLANFPEVDCFVVVACPENTLYDSKEYFRPIVTPYELAVALDYGEWTESYETDFRKVLQGVEDLTTTSRSSENHLLESDQKHCSLSIPNPLTLGKYHFDSDGNSRVWRGLEPGVHENTVKKAEIGRSGLAMCYSTTGDLIHSREKANEA